MQETVSAVKKKSRNKGVPRKSRSRAFQPSAPTEELVTKTGPKQDQQPSQDSKKEVGFTLNWNRALHINKLIDEVLLRELTPAILRMRQENSDPVTIGIDSPGGRMDVMEALLSLLKSPDQDDRTTKFYTVVTNRAYSAAATFLAFGDYSVSFPKAEILFHDVRYSGMDDVTPSKALEAARNLERRNALFSLELANQIRRRLVWVYIALSGFFQEARAKLPRIAEEYDDKFREFFQENAPRTVDVVGFALALYWKLSSPVDNEIARQALERLDSWIQVERLEDELLRTSKDQTLTDITQKVDSLIGAIRKINSKSPSEVSTETASAKALTDSKHGDVKLLLEVLAKRFADDNDFQLDRHGLDALMEDFAFVKDMNNKQHIQAVTRLMTQHSHIFFENSTAEKLRQAKDETERNEILRPVYPQARLFWHYMVLICRCLCRGEHLLSPSDAQLLGLVDEVLGGGLIESRREFRKRTKDRT